jgi:hypothetical protein
VHAEGAAKVPEIFPTRLLFNSLEALGEGPAGLLHRPSGIGVSQEVLVGIAPIFRGGKGLVVVGSGFSTAQPLRSFQQGGRELRVAALDAGENALGSDSSAHGAAEKIRRVGVERIEDLEEHFHLEADFAPQHATHVAFGAAEALIDGGGGTVAVAGAFFSEGAEQSAVAALGRVVVVGGGVGVFSRHFLRHR